MRGLQQGFPESIDEVVSAVEETPRGRWFLQAYAERLRKGETASILSAIEKLESSLKSMSSTGAEAKLVETTRAAIAQARQDIRAMSPEISGLSPEGQLFVKLAEQSRQAFANGNESPGISKGVERAIRLVADLERNFASPDEIQSAPAAPAAAYFRQDESIFEPAPTKPLIVVSQQRPAAEPQNRGARLVIERVGETSREPLPSLSKEDDRASDVFGPPPVAEAEDKPRITIIRHEVEDLPEVPLPDMAASLETTSAA